MSTEIIDLYSAMEVASEQMLEAARAGNWDEVIALEDACLLLISQLKEAKRGRNLTSEEVQRKSHIMERVLVMDAELRRLAVPWLDQLDLKLQGLPDTLH